MNKRDKYKLSNRIAVVRTDKLGDMILTLPLCAAIKRDKPDCFLTIICSKYSKELVENINIINQVLYIEDFKEGIKDIFKDYKFDAVFFPRPKSEEAYAAFMSGIKLRIGSAYRLYSFMFNFRIKDHRKESAYSEAEYNVRMLNSVTGTEHPVIPVKPNLAASKRLSLISKLQAIGLKLEDKYVVIHPGSGGSAKDWPAERFGELSNLLANKLNFNVILTGVDSERKVVDKVKSFNTGIIDLCGKLDLGELKVLLSEANLFISNSTGTLHIAAVLGAPVVGFFPNTKHISAKRWAPLSPNQLVLSPIDGSDDMNFISVDYAFGNISKFVNKEE